MPGSDAVVGSGVGDGLDVAVGSRGVAVEESGIVGSNVGDGIGVMVGSVGVGVGAGGVAEVSAETVAVAGISATLKVTDGRVASLVQPINQNPSSPINQIRPI